MQNTKTLLLMPWLLGPWLFWLMACTPAQGPSINYPQGELVYPEPQFNTPITFIAPDPDTKTRATYKFVPSGHTIEHRALEQRALAPDKDSIDQDILHIRLDHLKEDQTALSAPPSSRPKVLRVSLVLEHNLSLIYLIEEPPRGDCKNSPLSKGGPTGSSNMWHSAQKDSPYKLALQCCDLKCTHAQGGVKKEDDTLFYFSHNTSYPEAQFETIPKGQKTKTSFFSDQKIKAQKQSFTVAHGVSRSVVELQSHPHLMQISFNNLDLGAHAAPLEVNFRKWDGTNWTHSTFSTSPDDNQILWHNDQNGNSYFTTSIVDPLPTERYRADVTEVSDHIKWSIISKSLTVPIAHPMPTQPIKKRSFLERLFGIYDCSEKNITKCYPNSVLDLKVDKKLFNNTAQHHVNKQLNALSVNENLGIVQNTIDTLAKEQKTKNYFTNLYALRPLVQHFFTEQGIAPSAAHVLYVETNYVNKNFPDIHGLKAGDGGKSHGPFQIKHGTYRGLLGNPYLNLTASKDMRYGIDSSFLLSAEHFKKDFIDKKYNLEFLMLAHNTGTGEDGKSIFNRNQLRYNISAFKEFADNTTVVKNYQAYKAYALKTMALHFMGLRPECYLENLIDSSKNPPSILFKVDSKQVQKLKSHMYTGKLSANDTDTIKVLTAWQTMLQTPNSLNKQKPLTIKAECKYKPNSSQTQ